MNVPPFRAFTHRYSHRVNTLITKITISAPFDPAKGQAQPAKGGVYAGIWDTGAMRSVITQKVVDDGNLQPVGITNVYTAGGMRQSPIYLVSVCLPNNVWFNEVTTTLGEIVDNVDVLIGMDIIGMGDFAITHFDDKTTFTFRCPSTGHLDFVQQIDHAQGHARIGRNDPCFCGSGKKYKLCHGVGAK